MIENQFLVPECYINKIPKCDDCKVALHDTNIMLPTDPPQWQFVCPQCNKTYNYYERDLRGEWKFKTI